jgi:glucose uptake protein GlcU
MLLIEMGSKAYDRLMEAPLMRFLFLKDWEKFLPTQLFGLIAVVLLIIGLSFTYLRFLAWIGGFIVVIYAIVIIIMISIRFNR